MSTNVTIRERIRPFTREVIAGVGRNLTDASWYLVGDIMRGLGHSPAPGIGSGRMLGSMTQVMVRPLEHWVGSTIQPRAGQEASYPYYLELGFRHWKSHVIIQFPWLRPALDRSKVIMLKMIGRDVTR